MQVDTVIFEAGRTAFI